jgi:hypothetical protein
LPQLRALKNAEPFCVVGSADVRTFSFCVWADLWGPERSLVAVSGRSRRGGNGLDDFLTWALPVELRAEDLLDLHFEEGATSMPGGEPIRRGSTGASHGTTRFESHAPGDAELREWESRPAVNECLRWHIEVNGAPLAHIGPARHAQHVSLELQWNDARPDRVRVTLSASSLREVVRGSRGQTRFEDAIAIGSRVTIAILE